MDSGVVTIDGSGKVNYYNHFENGVFGSAGMGESGAISFNLNNNLEAQSVGGERFDCLEG